MNRKIIDNVFLITCVCLLFYKIPTPIQMKFLAGVMGTNLTIYPLLVGFIYTIRCCYKEKEVPPNFKIFIKFSLVYISVLTLSTLVGLYIYPYSEMAFVGSISQIDRLSSVYSLLNEYGIVLEEKFVLIFGFIVVKIAGILAETFWYFGTAYLVYYWYREDWRHGVHIFCKGIIISLCMFLIYGTVDTLYLMGNQTAKYILIMMHPYLHDHYWLLYNNQLRSVFTEPSHVGNYIAVALPTVWYLYLRYSHKLILLLSCITVLFIIFTQSRTAYAMLFFTSILISVLVFIKRKYLNRLLSILLCMVIVFFIGVQMLPIIGTNNRISVYTNRDSSQVLNDNLFSLNSSEKRSNIPRYAYINSNLQTFKEHPLLGVGRGLATEYNIKHLTSLEKNDMEIKENIHLVEQYGVLHSNTLSDAMNEYITRLAQNGILGLIVFLFPFIYYFYKVLKMFKYKINFESDFLLLFIILISSLVAASNGSVTVVPSSFIILGLCYASLNKKNNYNND